MPTKFNMTRDINGYNGFGLPFSLDGSSGLLAVGVAQSVVVPSTYPWFIAVFSYTPGASVWVNNITTAAAPSGAASASTSVLNPAGRIVAGGSTLSFITADTTSPLFQVSFFVAPPFGN